MYKALSFEEQVKLQEQLVEARQKIVEQQAVIEKMRGDLVCFVGIDPECYTTQTEALTKYVNAEVVKVLKELAGDYLVLRDSAILKIVDKMIAELEKK